MEVRTLAKILHKNQPCTMPAYNTWCFNNLKYSVCFQTVATSFAEIFNPWANNATAKMWAVCIPTMTQPKFKNKSYTLDTGHR